MNDFNKCLLGHKTFFILISPENEYILLIKCQLLFEFHEFTIFCRINTTSESSKAKKKILIIQLYFYVQLKFCNNMRQGFNLSQCPTVDKCYDPKLRSSCESVQSD